MKKARSIGVSILVILIAAAVVYFALRKKEVGIAGDYLVKVNGTYTGATASIVDNESSYTVTIEGVKDLRKSYEMTKTSDNRFTITEYSGVDKVSEYELRAVKKGLEGTAWVLPVGKIELFFERNRK